MPPTAPVTVVETPEFLSVAERLFTESERELLIEFLAHNPLAGDLIPGTGGVRKVRWALPGRGKSSGARVIYYYHNPTVPLFALTAYAKGEQSDLRQTDRNTLKRLTKLLVDTYRRANR